MFFEDVSNLIKKTKMGRGYKIYFETNISTEMRNKKKIDKKMRTYSTMMLLLGHTLVLIWLSDKKQYFLSGNIANKDHQ